MDKTSLMTARELGQMLIAHDPDGTRAVKVRVFDEEAPDDMPAAVGELLRSEVDVSIKHGQQTDFGDLDLVRIDVRLEIN